MNRRLGVLISGRGSNLQALIDAVRAGRLQATIAVVISNCADAAGLERARQAGIETLCIDHRAFRSRDEHDARNAAWMSGARENVVVSALDGGGFLAALVLEAVDGEEPKALRETGETEDAAREAVLKPYEESLPKFEAPPATWDEVMAAGAAAADDEAAAPGADAVAEVEQLVAEQAADAAADGPKTLLKVPKGRRARRIKVVDEGGAEITEESLAEPTPAAPAPVDGVAVLDLCPPDCSDDHAHSERRAPF